MLRRRAGPCYDGSVAVGLAPEKIATQTLTRINSKQPPPILILNGFCHTGTFVTEMQVKIFSQKHQATVVQESVPWVMHMSSPPVLSR